MNHLGFLALVYLILVPFGVPSPSKELCLALAYLLCCYQLEIATALDRAPNHRRLTTLTRSLRENRIAVTVSAGDFAWHWPRR